MSRTGSLYIKRESLFHKLDGSVKLFMWLCWTIFTFMFMDARIFTVMIVVGFTMLALSKLPFKSIRPVIIFIIIFTIFNSFLLLLVTPEYGSKLTGKYTVLFNISKYKVTYETLFYALTLSLKYFCMLPITLLFIFTTEPSAFAGSLNRLGISYKVSYSISIALRYIPDVRDEANNIINAQEARGIAFRKGDAGIYTRMKNYVLVLLPLLLSSLQRIEVVSNAMELRGFGKNKKRTWYGRNKLGTIDIVFFVLSIALVILGIYLKSLYFKKFWCI